MIKKILLSAAIIPFIFSSASTQFLHAELGYQSFRPFINFRIELGNSYQYQRDTYKTAYIKGYMDGVNRRYYDAYRFYELVQNIEAYELGYRDGTADRRLLQRLRGTQRAQYFPFGYDDYYSPYFSVQLWLNQLSFTFIQAPAHRLPTRWSYHIDSRLKRYRYRVHHHQRYKQRFNNQYRYYKKRLRSQAQHVQRKYRKRGRSYNHTKRTTLNRNQARKQVHNRSRGTDRVRARSNRSPNVRTQGESRVTERSARGSRVKRSQSSKREKVRSRSKRTKRKAVKKNKSKRKVKRSRSQEKRKKVRKRSSRSKQKKVKHKRSRSSKSKKRGGSRKRSRGGN